MENNEEGQEKSNKSPVDSVKSEVKGFVNEVVSEAAGTAATQLANSAGPLSQFVFLVKVALGLIAVIGIYILGVKFNLFPDYFTPKPVTIDNTAVVVTGMKKISQLMSVNYSVETVVDSVVYKETTMSEVSGFFERQYNKLFGSEPKQPKKTMTKVKDIVYVVNGKVYGGFDLSNLSESDITMSDSSIRIRVDEPKILDVVVNPDGFSLFAKNGSWSFQEVSGVKTKAKEKIRKKALENGILDRCRTNGLKSIESFYRAMGFKKVEVVIAAKKD
jgi:hypothetical protein